MPFLYTMSEALIDVVKNWKKYDTKAIYDILRSLLDAGADANKQDKYGYTALMSSAQ